MTKLLQKAFDEASRLENDQQDVVAKWLLDELTDERRWDEAFANSQDMLASLADAALTEHRDGRTRPLNPDTL